MIHPMRTNNRITNIVLGYSLLRAIPFLNQMKNMGFYFFRNTSIKLPSTRITSGIILIIDIEVKTTAKLSGVIATANLRASEGVAGSAA